MNVVRLSINLSESTSDELKRLAEVYEVSVTEEVRRLVGLGRLVERHHHSGGRVLLEAPDREALREVVIL